MIWFSTSVLALIVVLAQVSIGRACSLLDGTPHLVVLTVIYFATWAPRPQSVFLAIASGLFLDLLSLDALLVNATALACIAYATGALQREALLERSAMRALVAVFSVAIYYAARFLLARLLEGIWLDAETLIRSLLVTLVYAWPVFSVYSGFHQQLILEPKRAAHRL